MAKRQTPPGATPAQYVCPCGHKFQITTGQPAPLTVKCPRCKESK